MNENMAQRTEAWTLTDGTAAILEVEWGHLLYPGHKTKHLSWPLVAHKVIRLLMVQIYQWNGHLKRQLTG